VPPNNRLPEWVWRGHPFGTSDKLTEGDTCLWHFYRFDNGSGTRQLDLRKFVPTDLEDLVGREGETSGFAIFASIVLARFLRPPFWRRDLLADRLRMKEVFLFVLHHDGGPVSLPITLLGILTAACHATMEQTVVLHGNQIITVRH
jgi:hypothetical protein